MPKAEAVTRWSADWAETKTEEEIRKAFDVCGLVSEAEFAVEALHKPLQDIFKHEMAIDEWLGKYAAFSRQFSISTRIATCRSENGWNLQ